MTSDKVTIFLFNALQTSITFKRDNYCHVPKTLFRVSANFLEAPETITHVAKCCGLNVCVPSPHNSYVEILTPQCGIIRRWGLQ